MAAPRAGAIPADEGRDEEDGDDSALVQCSTRSSGGWVGKSWGVLVVGRHGDR